MILDFDDIIDGAIDGMAVLQVKKAEIRQAGDKPVLDVTYTILEGEPQGPKGVDPAGEFVSATVWLPSSVDEPEKIRNKKRMVKQFLKVHGVDTEGQIEINDVPQFLMQNAVVVKGKLGVNQYYLDNFDEARTEVKRFYKAD